MNRNQLNESQSRNTNKPKLQQTHDKLKQTDKAKANQTCNCNIKGWNHSVKLECQI